MKTYRFKLAVLALVAALIPQVATSASSMLEAEKAYRELVLKCRADLEQKNAEAQMQAASTVSALMMTGDTMSFWDGDWSEVAALSDRLPQRSRMQNLLRFRTEFDAVAAMEQNPHLKPQIVDVIQALSGLTPITKECGRVPVIVDLQHAPNGQGWMFMVTPPTEPTRRGLASFLWGPGQYRPPPVPLTVEKHSEDPNAPAPEEVRYFTDKQVNNLFNTGATYAQSEFGPSAGYWYLAMHKIFEPKLDNNCGPGDLVYQLVSSEEATLRQKLQMADDMFEATCGRRPMGTDRDASY